LEIQEAEFLNRSLVSFIHLRDVQGLDKGFCFATIKKDMRNIRIIMNKNKGSG